MTTGWRQSGKVHQFWVTDWRVFALEPEIVGLGTLWILGIYTKFAPGSHYQSIFSVKVSLWLWWGQIWENLTSSERLIGEVGEGIRHNCTLQVTDAKLMRYLYEASVLGPFLWMAPMMDPCSRADIARTTLKYKKTDTVNRATENNVNAKFNKQLQNDQIINLRICTAVSIPIGWNCIFNLDIISSERFIEEVGERII